MVLRFVVPEQRTECTLKKSEYVALARVRVVVLEVTLYMFESRLKSIKQRIWPGALFALSVTFLTPALFGSTCAVGTLTSYESGANFGCTLGPDAGYTMDFESFTPSGVDLLTP